MGLNSDKTSKVFCINICCFSTSFYLFLYHSGTVIQVSSTLWMFLISTPHKTRTFIVRLAVTTNTKETVLQQQCCLEWTRPPKSRPNSHNSLCTLAQRKRASMLYFPNVFYLIFLWPPYSPAHRRFAKLLHVVYLECR